MPNVWPVDRLAHRGPRVHETRDGSSRSLSKARPGAQQRATLSWSNWGLLFCILVVIEHGHRRVRCSLDLPNPMRSAESLTPVTPAPPLCHQRVAPTRPCGRHRDVPEISHAALRFRPRQRCGQRSLWAVRSLAEHRCQPEYNLMAVQRTGVPPARALLSDRQSATDQRCVTCLRSRSEGPRRPPQAAAAADDGAPRPRIA
jgi:hypothetical protein